MSERCAGTRRSSRLRGHEKTPLSCLKFVARDAFAVEFERNDVVHECLLIGFWGHTHGRFHDPCYTTADRDACDQVS